MAVWLKRGVTSEARADLDRKVRDTVEGILADIEKRGNEAVRELSIKFDGWDRKDYRLTPQEVQDCIDQLTGQDLKDIEFAQNQVRNFAQIQKDSMKEVEVETLPGVILGHKHVPVNGAGCYVPGGKYPLLASAHMSVITAKVAGVPRVVMESMRHSDLKLTMKSYMDAAQLRGPVAAAVASLPWHQTSAGRV